MADLPVRTKTVVPVDDKPVKAGSEVSAEEKPVEVATEVPRIVDFTLEYMAILTSPGQKETNRLSPDKSDDFFDSAPSMFYIDDHFRARAKGDRTLQSFVDSVDAVVRKNGVEKETYEEAMRVNEMWAAKERATRDAEEETPCDYVRRAVKLQWDDNFLYPPNAWNLALSLFLISLLLTIITSVPLLANSRFLKT